MTSPRSLPHDLHIDVRQLGGNETEEKQSVVTPTASGLDPRILKDLHVYFWDSLSVFACGSSFVLMFYLREDMHKAGAYGYELQNFFEALISLTAVYPFALKSRFVNGDNHGEAIRKMARSIPVYLPLNGLFQPTKDLCVAINASGSLLHFEFKEYGNAAYEPIEALSALVAYGAGFGLTYALLSKLMRLPVTALDILKAGQQYYLSYLIGGLFNTDLTVGISRLPNVFYSGLVLAGANFLYDVVTDREIMRALKNHHCGARPVQASAAVDEASEAKEIGGAMREAPVASLVPSETAPVDNKREPLLSSQERQAADNDSPRQSARWNKSCYEILKSYCFWSKSKSAPVRPVANLSQPIATAGYKK
jgi:hypothetical protein